MKKLRLAPGVLLLALLSIGVAAGQGAPAQIEVALLDLGARLGHTIELGGLSNWRWEQTNFADSALGCPTVAGTGAAALGYKFLLTYNAVTYDYRVSTDNSVTVFCGILENGAAARHPSAQYSNRLCPADALDGPYMRSRINFGMDVEVEVDLLNMRGQPSTAGQLLLQIPAGFVIPVTSGPDCVEGLIWWLVNVNGQTGYIAEAGDGIYSVTPPRLPAMPDREVLNVNLAPFVQKLAEVRGNFLPQHSWSRAGESIALAGAPGSDSIWLFDLRSQQLAPQLFDFRGGLSQIAFQPTSDRLLIGSEEGSLHLWRLTPGAAPIARETLFLNAHAGAVSAIAFSPSGNRFVSAGPVAYSQLAGARDWAAIEWDLPSVAQRALLAGNQGLIRALAYSPDGSEVAAGADDGTLRFWNAENGASLSVLDLGAPVTALDYSPDGRLLAVGVARASDNLLMLDASVRAQSASYPLPTNSVAAVDFSPDGDMLVVGATEGVFTIWDTQNRELLLSRETDGAVGDLSFSPDGTAIAVATDKFALAFYGLPRGSG